MLVEAAAGTGKTSLMAARVAMMIASGIDPSKIAAITFTEPAASELEARIRWTVDELRHGRLPPALAGILSLSLGTAERAHLDEAAPRIGEITATTIHGFCQGILRSHGIDAGLDPGSRVVDAAKNDPLGVVERVRELAILRRGASQRDRAGVGFLNSPEPHFRRCRCRICPRACRGSQRDVDSGSHRRSRAPFCVLRGRSSKRGVFRVVAPEPAAAHQHDAAEKH
ncbi:UvrD-helicase domain-containing protein [Bradyrhizobium sp. LB12.1]|uniref:UvrD-helicase domain-containing protein n=1 Tax=Bradyrhizobium sp. LB12.1 TaxID=3156327 RepID=UPI0033994015